jgi:serine/threonine-protein kinase
MTQAAFFVMLWASKGKAKEASMKCSSCHTENPPDSKFCKECATPLPPLRPSPPLVTETLETAREEITTGSLFAGRYQIIEELGHGGMGRVYRALDKKLNEEVALKLLRPEVAADADPGLPEVADAQKRLAALSR